MAGFDLALNYVPVSVPDRDVAPLGAAPSYSERVREYVLTRPPARRRNMNVVARGLGVSARTLRRRLSEEGARYVEIVESTLATLAKRLISEEALSIESAAQAMGYSDSTAFHRAFKRWTGSTPREYRLSRPRSVPAVLEARPI